jgi:Icc-related predicted phosphoesterase
MASIVALSDLHGNLCDIPECDILILAGDICPDAHSLLQAKWLDVAFRDWLNEVPAKHVVTVAGNHDLIFERATHLVPKDLRWHYLEDKGVELEGLKIWGMPWIVPIWGAFQQDEGGLEKKYAKIPDDIDIVISHGPPFGIGDLAPRRLGGSLDGEHVGSPALLSRLYKVKPQLVVFGHIHEGQGVYPKDGILFGNASLLNKWHAPANYPLNFVINPRQ